jgi:DNA-3-methyladenine glycosylase II
VIATLCQIKGIGRWTAEMFLIFSLGRLDVLPVDDLG